MIIHSAIDYMILDAVPDLLNRKLQVRLVLPIKQFPNGKTEKQSPHERYLLSQKVPEDYYEPGMMEYLDQSDGEYNEETKSGRVRFEVKGTRYDGRTELIEKVHTGDTVKIVRDPENKFNTNNFRVYSENDKDLGNLPAALCNAAAPLYDAGNLIIRRAKVSFVDPITKRSRYAKQSMLFVEMEFEHHSDCAEPQNADK